MYDENDDTNFRSDLESWSNKVGRSFVCRSFIQSNFPLRNILYVIEMHVDMHKECKN